MSKEKITSLAGIKATAMLLLFVWHSPLPDPPVDLGARMCEILFICAGFLIAYNHFDEDFPLSFDHVRKYLLGKMIKIWPIHFIAFLLAALERAAEDPQGFFKLKTLFSAIVNLSFLQAWSTDCFSFNGAAWFISALLFCYLMTPVFLAIMKRSNTLILLVFCMTVRIVLELASVNDISVFELNFHVSPVIRCIEFFIGMLLYPVFIKLKHKCEPAKKSQNILISLAEIAVLSSYIFLSIRFNEIWIRGYFVIVSCILVLVFSLNDGLVSKFFSLEPFCRFSKIQLEFYLFHQAVIIFMKPFFFPYSVISPMLATIIDFVIVLLAAIFYKTLLSKSCTKIMTALFRKETGHGI